MTQVEAAPTCVVSEDTIRRAKNRGDLSAKKLSRDRHGNGVGKELYRVRDFEAWLESPPPA
ncbi:hypothetical protein GCM10023226_40810 [Nocardioides nanhaiensis]|uniref:DNA-binding protein n=1 Tax=Nocardioides nanhaiensis TaxID=1476871 RepID=A0ABP8X3H2_9ACTN